MDPQTLLAVDPGEKRSAWLLYDLRQSRPREFDIQNNGQLLSRLQHGQWPWPPPHLVCESVESYGMAVGESVFETVWWSGRFYQCWRQQGGSAQKLSRRRVKMQLCNSAKAKDTNIRCRLIDLFGGSRETAIGTKPSPGPLYGIKTHLWAALAVAVAWEQGAGK